MRWAPSLDSLPPPTPQPTPQPSLLRRLQRHRSGGGGRGKTNIFTFSDFLFSDFFV
jgi:hypothetical protein